MNKYYKIFGAITLTI